MRNLYTKDNKRVNKHQLVIEKYAVTLSQKSLKNAHLNSKYKFLKKSLLFVPSTDVITLFVTSYILLMSDT